MINNKEVINTEPRRWINRLHLTSRTECLKEVINLTRMKISLRLLEMYS